MSLTLTAGLRSCLRTPLPLRLTPCGLVSSSLYCRQLSTSPRFVSKNIARPASILSQLRPGLLSKQFLSSYGVRARSLATSSEEPPSSAPTSPQQMSEDILTVPNLLTILRLALTPYIGYLVCTAQFIPAVSLLFIAAVTDLLDGWLARRSGKFTVFGSIADPAADKALVTTMVVSLAVSGMLPWALAVIILGRDVALVISAFVIRYRTLSEPKTFKRYFNPSLPSATVTPTTISKYNTFLQLLLVGLLTLYPILFPTSSSPKLLPTQAKSDPPVLAATSAKPSSNTKVGITPYVSPQTKDWIDKAVTALMWITGFTTIYSGLGYLGGAGATKTLKSGGLLSQKVAQLRRSATPGATKPPPAQTDSKPPSPPPSV